MSLRDLAIARWQDLRWSLAEHLAWRRQDKICCCWAVLRTCGAKQKWTPEEEQALRAGVARHGVGKWRLIQKDAEFSGILATRSNVDLKDKWRNLNMEAGGSRAERRGARSNDSSGSGGQGSRRKRRRRPVQSTEEPSSPASDGLLALRQAPPRPTRQRRSTSMPEEPLEADPPIPTMVDMVTAAIVALHETQGSACESILQWLEARYGLAHPFRKQIRATLETMLDSNRLEKTPGTPALYRIGGTVGRLAGSTDPATWRAYQAAAPSSSNPQTARQAAEAAAAAIREAEDAAEHASRLEAGTAVKSEPLKADPEASPVPFRLAEGTSPPLHSSAPSSSQPLYGPPALNSWLGQPLPLSLQQELSLRGPADRGHQEPPDRWAEHLSRPQTPLDMLGAAAAAAELQFEYEADQRPPPTE